MGGFGVAQKAAEKMKQKYPDLIIAGHEDGHPQEISTQCVKANSDVMLVAFGAPAQEFWIDRFHAKIPNCKIAGGFGGTFDFWSGNVKRAPQWMQNLGLEWLFRLLKEPQRIKRIYNAVVRFSFLVLKEKTSK